MGGHEDQAEEVVREITVDKLGELGFYDLRAGSGYQAHLVAVGVPSSDPVDG